jgi:hypothetical protein
MWHLIFQSGDLPISVRREDGVAEDPPPGLIRYIELSYGAWTVSPATQPQGIEGVEWPNPCVWRNVTGCQGSMVYVDHVVKQVTMATGEKIHPAGWQCDTCGSETVFGFSSMTIETIIDS